jgi:hypothetical protein
MFHLVALHVLHEDESSRGKNMTYSRTIELFLQYVIPAQEVDGGAVDVVITVVTVVLVAA